MKNLPCKKMDDIFLRVLVVRLDYHLRLVSPLLSRKTVTEPICWRKTWSSSSDEGKMEIGGMCKWSWGEDEDWGLYPPPAQRPIRPVSAPQLAQRIPVCNPRHEWGEWFGCKRVEGRKAPAGILIWWRRCRPHRRCPSWGRRQSFGCCVTVWEDGTRLLSDGQNLLARIT